MTMWLLLALFVGNALGFCIVSNKDGSHQFQLPAVVLTGDNCLLSTCGPSHPDQFPVAANATWMPSKSDSLFLTFEQGSDRYQRHNLIWPGFNWIFQADGSQCGLCSINQTDPNAPCSPSYSSCLRATTTDPTDGFELSLTIACPDYALKNDTPFISLAERPAQNYRVIVVSQTACDAQHSNGNSGSGSSPGSGSGRHGGGGKGHGGLIAGVTIGGLAFIGGLAAAAFFVKRHQERSGVRAPLNPSLAATATQQPSQFYQA